MIKTCDAGHGQNSTSVSHVVTRIKLLKQYPLPPRNQEESELKPQHSTRGCVSRGTKTATQKPSKVTKKHIIQSTDLCQQSH